MSKIIINMKRELLNRIYYVGVNDRQKTLFENMLPLPYGVSYNAYFIDDEKTVLVDTVEQPFAEQLLAHVQELLAGRELDYLIVNHMEPDHSSGIKTLQAIYPNMQIVANAKTIEMLGGYYGIREGFHVVKDGDSLNIGSRTLQFHFAPMVHWPEVMVSYDSTDKVLFAADGFGKFGALCYDDEWAPEARRYYYNICGKYGAPVQALLKKAATLDISIICPLHGPVLTENLGYYLGLYDMWSKYEPESNGVVVAYASIHGNTADAARKFADILRAKGAEDVVVLDLSRDDMSVAVEAAFNHARLVVAAASYDSDVFPPMHDFLHHLAIKGFCKRRIGIIENGSWAPSAGRAMRNIIDRFKDVQVVEPMVTILSRLKPSDVPALEALADDILADKCDRCVE